MTTVLGIRVSQVIVGYLQDELAKISEQYRELSGGVTERQKTLARITDELETVKQEMEERGSSMTDGSKTIFYFFSLTLNELY